MSEFFSNFGIDWKLLASQAINFFILLFLLKKFAYQPILQMLRKRKEDIEKGIQFTKEAETKLAKVDEVTEEKIKESQKRALRIIAQAEDSAKAEKEKIAQEARNKVESIVADGKRLLAEEKVKMEKEALAGAGELIGLGIAKVLGKMPSSERDDFLIKEALKELKGAKNI